MLQTHQANQLEELQVLGVDAPVHNLMFISLTNTPISHRNLTRTWHTLQAKAQIPRANLHDLRHMFATNLHYAGVPLKTASGLLGHSRPSTTLDIYTHFAEDAPVEVVPRVAPAQEEP